MTSNNGAGSDQPSTRLHGGGKTSTNIRVCKKDGLGLNLNNKRR